MEIKLRLPLLILIIVIFFSNALYGQYTLSGGMVYGGVRMDNDFTVRYDNGYSLSQSRRLNGVLGGYVSADYALHRNLKLQVGMGLNYGNLTDTVTRGTRSSLAGTETFAYIQTREVGSKWVHLLVQVPVLQRRFGPRFWLGAGLTGMTYHQDYLTEIVVDERSNNIITRTFKRERYSTWGYPVQIHYREQVTPRWAAEAKWTMAFLETKTLQSILQIGVAYTIED